MVINRVVLSVSLMALCMISGSHVRADQAGQFNGRPVFREGSERSYFVWRDGDTWHIRWTTMGRMLRFTGRVEADGGELRSLKRIDVEEERRVIRSGQPGRVVVGPRGRVRVRPGRPPIVATREQDRIEKDGDRSIVWVARTDADIDGFDFKVNERVQALRFRLEIEGSSNPRDVEAGRDNQHPSSNPFRVVLR